MKKLKSDSFANICTTYDLIPIPVFLTDMDKKIVYANAMFCKTIGFTCSEMIGDIPAMFKSDEMTDKFYKNMWYDVSLYGSWNGKIHSRKKNGTFHWLHLTISKVEIEHKQYYIIVGDDVTSDVNMIYNLTEKSLMLDKMFAILPNVVYIYDIKNGSNVYYNKMLLTMTGYSSLELENNKNYMDSLLVHPDDIAYFTSHIERIKRGEIFNKDTNVAVSIEYRLIEKYGDIIYIIDKQIPFKYDKEGNVEQILGIVIDVTLLKEKYTLIENNSYVKDRLMSILAHDIKNPFQVILGYSELIVDAYNDNEMDNILSYLQKLKESILLVDELFSNVISWSRVNNLVANKIKIQLVDYIAYVASKYKNLIELKNIRLNINIDSDIYVYADDYMLSSIIGNLLTNAIKFTNQNGNIKIEASVRKTNDKVDIRVIDDGIGIKPEMIKDIFELDFISNVSIGTIGEKGSGLGISICKEFIKKHNGTLVILSDGIKGTNIQFDVPGFKKI